MKVRMKLQALGHKPSDEYMPEIVSKKDKKSVVFPKLELNSDDIDGLEELKQGDKCVLEFNAEVQHTESGSRYSDDPAAKKRTTVTFKLTHGEVEPADEEKGEDESKEYRGKRGLKTTIDAVRESKKEYS